MKDEFTLTLNSPITEKQWDAITDVDFEHTNEITFHTKHGKEVVFVKKSAQPDQRWIPCSEKLPESIKPVIITWRNNDPKSYYQYIVGKPFIGTGHYCKGKWFWYSSTCEDLLAEYGRSDVDEIDEAIEVIAWMPLPEPYRGEQK